MKFNLSDFCSEYNFWFSYLFYFRGVALESLGNVRTDSVEHRLGTAAVDTNIFTNTIGVLQ